MKDFLKQHSSYLDNVAVEVMKTIIRNRPPTSPDDSANIASISYKQALAMLDAKMSLEQILNKTKFLPKERRQYKSKLKEDE